MATPQKNHMVLFSPQAVDADGAEVNREELIGSGEEDDIEFGAVVELFLQVKILQRHFGTFGKELDNSRVGRTKDILGLTQF